MSDWIPPPFERTSCACTECQACCTRQPGPLAPGDFERIAAFLGQTPDEAKRHFWASRGALVMNTETRRQFRIGSITPRIVRKRCVFLTPQNRCAIHAVAPVGCAYFDPHMSAFDAIPRTIWLHREMQDVEYQRLRATLPFADNYK